MERIANTRVALFGLGGVGSWCAEALARNGIGAVTIVDSDFVCITNINRQIQASHKTIGKSKVKLLEARLLDINPELKIDAQHKAYDIDTQAGFDFTEYDYVIDAIDSLGNKVSLIQSALASDTILFSSLGASCKIDPTRVRIGSFWKVKGCPLGRKLRQRLRNRNVEKDFLCVYSDENLPNYPVELPCGTGQCLCPEQTEDEWTHDWCRNKKRINGSAVQVTATFGMFLAGLVINDIKEKVGDAPPEAPLNGSLE